MLQFVENQRQRLETSFICRAFVPLAAILLATMSCPAPLDAAGPKSRLVEIKDAEKTYVGKVVAKCPQNCYLMDRFGGMAYLPISRLESFKVVGEGYRSSTFMEFRQQLLAEFPSGYEIRNSAHYIVVAKKGRATAFASLFEEIYHQVDAFYKIRGFETNSPEVLLVAIVLGTQEEFKEYCGRDEVLWSKDLRGYYSLKSNRVALYDDPSLLNSVTSVQPTSTLPNDQFKALINSVSGETADTVVHETTHQVGYNIGIHSRLGETPSWVVEGLATVLEAPGLRSRGKASGKSGGEKVNPQRLEWFRGEYESRRKPGDIAKMIASDDFFRSQALDAYSAAWAFTYFMTENPARARKYVRYLKLLGERDPMQAYSAEDRLKDFQSVFGDIARLEVDFLRSMDRVESP